MGRIRDLDVVKEKIRQSVNLEDVVEFYGHDLQPYGNGHKVASCPFHSETEPSFAVQTEKQVYFCYGCKESGDIFTFVQKMEAITFLEAIRWLAEYGSIDLRPYESPETKEEKLQRGFISLNESVLEHAEAARGSAEFRTWQKKRYLKTDVLETYRVGYSSAPWSPKGSSADDAKKLGLKGGRGPQVRWTDVVVVPIFNDQGKCVAYRNRPLGEGTLKTVTVNSDHPLPIPPIYGFYQARSHIRKAKKVIIVEGEVDVWQMVSNGYGYTCGGFGTNISVEMLDWLYEHGVSEVIFMPDADEAGRKFARKVASIRHKHVAIKIAILKEGDPDEALLSDPEIVSDALESAVYGVEYLVNDVLSRDIFTMSQKKDALRELQPIIAESTKVEGEMVVQILAERFGIDPIAVADFFLEEAPGAEKLYDTRAERSVLANAIANSEMTGRMVIALEPKDFYLRKHEQIATAISHLYRHGHEVSLATVEITLERMGFNEALDYVSTLDVDGPADFMIDVVKDKASRRYLQIIGRTLVTETVNPTYSTDQISQTAMAGVSRVVVGGDDGLKHVNGPLIEVMDQIHERAKNPQLIVGLDLGQDWSMLNRTIHGLQTKRYMVIAAPAGVGKTTAMISLSSRIAVDLETPSLILTFETDRETIIKRLIAHRSGVRLENIITGHLDEGMMQRVHDAAAEIGASPLVITERGQIYEEAQALIQHDVISRGTKTVFVDYIQLMNLSNAKGIPRHQEVGNISRGFLDMARDLDLSVVALAQINREGLKKGGAAGHEDTGDSFKIAQDAMIFATMTEKDAEAIEEDGPEKGNRKLSISKNRADGQTGVFCFMHADPAIQRIMEV